MDLGLVGIAFRVSIGDRVRVSLGASFRVRLRLAWAWYLT